MGTKYCKRFTPYLELFEPPSAYISELRLQYAWKNTLWKIPRTDLRGRSIRILSPGRHNHSDGPDFIDAKIMLGGKLCTGDIELHRRSAEWYAHKHHIDEKYNNCILHIVFQSSNNTMETRCKDGHILPICCIPLHEVLDLEPPGSCRIFKPDETQYFNILKKQGWERVNKKTRYFYENRLRFPGDVMLYWGLFKACGYRYNEDNMIKLFIRFPWAAYCDELIDRNDIMPMLRELAGFTQSNIEFEPIRWTHSRTRPVHFPELRVDWLGKLMTKYFRASLSGILFDLCKNSDDLLVQINKMLTIPEAQTPGAAIIRELSLNTILPLMEAMRKDLGEEGILRRNIINCIEKTNLPSSYGTVKRFHDRHGIEENDKQRRNWLVSQGVLNIQDHYCSQGMQLSCPICLLENTFS